MVVGAEFSGIPISSPQDGTAVGQAPVAASQIATPGNMTIQAGSLVIAVFAINDDASPVHVNGATTGQPGVAPTGFTALGTQYNGTTFEVGQAAYAIGPTSPSNPGFDISPDPAVVFASSQMALLATGDGGASQYRPVVLSPGFTTAIPGYLLTP